MFFGVLVDIKIFFKHFKQSSDIKMENYRLVKQLGDGTYGSVMLGSINETGEKVAIKKLLNHSDFLVFDFYKKKFIIENVVSLKQC